MSRAETAVVVPSGPHRRPSPLRWWWYAQGARLPVARREWVLHVLTSRSWWLRHVTRSRVQLVPVVVILVVLIPGPLWARGMAVMFGAAAHAGPARSRS